jgi:hypothetical protein
LCLAIVATTATATLGSAAERYVREQRTVFVGSVREVWQLRWSGKPSPVCGAENVDEAVVCPCAGFAYGEAGKLTLVRIRGGREIEGMDLGPFYDLGPAGFLEFP